MSSDRYPHTNPALNRTRYLGEQLVKCLKDNGERLPLLSSLKLTLNDDMLHKSQRPVEKKKTVPKKPLNAATFIKKCGGPDFPKVAVG